LRICEITNLSENEVLNESAEWYVNKIIYINARDQYLEEVREQSGKGTE